MINVIETEPIEVADVLCLHIWQNASIEPSE